MATDSVDVSDVQPQVLGTQVLGAAHPQQTQGLRNRVPAPFETDDGEEDEEDNFIDQQVPTYEERKWSLWVVIASAVDVVVSGVILGMAFGYAYRDNGVSLYSLGIQSLSHLLSSVILGVRFFLELKVTQDSSNITGSLLRRHRRRFLLREQGLSVSMGLIMLISSASLLFKAVSKFKFWNKWYQDHTSMDKEVAWVSEFLSWYGFSMYVLQAVFRYCAATKLRRYLIWHGFVTSIVSIIFLLVLGLAASYEKDELWWKAEPIAAMVLSVVTLIEGVRIIILHLDDMDSRLRYDPRA